MVLVFFTIRVGMVLWYWYHFSMNFEVSQIRRKTFPRVAKFLPPTPRQLF